MLFQNPLSVSGRICPWEAKGIHLLFRDGGEWDTHNISTYVCLYIHTQAQPRSHRGLIRLVFGGWYIDMQYK